MRNFLWGVAAALGATFIVLGSKRRETERAAEAWAAQTDRVDL